MFSIIYLKLVALFTIRIYTLYNKHSMNGFFMDYIAMFEAVKNGILLIDSFEYFVYRENTEVIQFKSTFSILLNAVESKNERLKNEVNC